MHSVVDEIARRFGSRIKVFVLDHNNGKEIATNSGATKYPTIILLNYAIQKRVYSGIQSLTSLETEIEKYIKLQSEPKPPIQPSSTPREGGAIPAGNVTDRLKNAIKAKQTELTQTHTSLDSVNSNKKNQPAVAQLYSSVVCW
jgi:hypothetical protein